MYERNLEEDNLQEKNFLIKVPAPGTYYLHLVSFAPKDKKFYSTFYFGYEQTDKKITQDNCIDTLAYNLRHCVPSSCKVDMTSSYLPLAMPPENVFYTYQIDQDNNTCNINITSNIDQDQSCRIPIEFNFLIQDCAYPLKDPLFTKKLNELNQIFYKTTNQQEIHDNSEKIQQLWLRHYPISLMCSRELSFQLPDLDLLMKKYCRDLPLNKNNTLVEWKNDLKAKIALKQASLNFRSATQHADNHSDSNNQIIEMLANIKKMQQSCQNKHQIKSCTELAEYYLEQKDFLPAAEASGKACNLGDSLSCQKAGLHYTQAKLRQKARAFEKKGCTLKDSISCYNVACGYCIDKQKDLALLYFKKHLNLGAEDPMHIIFDPTIQCIRETATFKQFIKKALAP